MKYKIYSTDSLEVLKNELLIGDANSYQEACAQITTWLEAAGKHSDKYWRLLLGENATFIDYGSWSHFIAIVPAVAVDEIMKGNKND